MSTPKQTLYQRATQIINEQCYLLKYQGNLKLTEKIQNPSFSAHINILTRTEIEMSYSPTFPGNAKTLEIIVADPFSHCIRALIRHEIGHKGGGPLKGCPRNIDLHLEHILEPIIKVAQAKGYADMPVGKGYTLTTYLANMLEDVIVNFENAKSGVDFIGMWIMYKDDAAQSGIFPPLFGGFIDLQEKLYGGKRSKKLIKDHYCNDPKAITAVESFMNRTGIQAMTRKVRGKQKFDRKSALRYMINEHHWESLATIFAEEFLNLVDKNKLNDSEYLKNTFIQLKGDGDIFESEIRDEETRMRYAWKRYQNSGSAYHPPSFLETEESLDLVYKQIARKLDITAKTSTKTQQFPLVTYGYRLFDPQKDPFSSVKILLKDGRINFGVHQHTITYPMSYTAPAQKLPEIQLVFLDTSASTRIEILPDGKIMNPWAPVLRQWKDTSVYHFELCTFYGLLEYLKRTSQLSQTGVKLANYSSATYVASTLKETKKLALQPQFGGTSLQLDQVKQMFGTGQLVISLSDGEIENWSAIKKEYLDRAKKSAYVHVQIGGESTMSRDLQTAGLNVVYDNGMGLPKIVVDIADGYLKSRRK